MIRLTLISIIVLTIPLEVFGQHAHYNVASNLSYLPEPVADDYARSQCRLDVYTPKGKSDFATIVWFHGGGLKGGTRQKGLKFAERFTKEGIAVVLVSYRLSPKVKHPVYIEDAAAAVAWTVRNIEKYKGNPKNVFVSGHSAGGYLTAIIGLDGKYLSKHNLSPDRLAGYMPIAGQMITHSTIREEREISKSRPLIDKYAPAYHVRKDARPFLCLVGSNDLPTRAEENLYFEAAMKAAGHKSTRCLVVEGRNHGSIAGRFDQEDDEVALSMIRFVKEKSK